MRRLILAICRITLTCCNVMLAALASLGLESARLDAWQQDAARGVAELGSRGR